jgi:hypothetical protein
MAEKPGSGDFHDLDSRTAILLQTPPWKSGGISGCTFQEANFFLNSSSIPRKTPLAEKTLSIFFSRVLQGATVLICVAQNAPIRNFDTNETSY